MGQAFFGLIDKEFYNREIFLLVYYGKFTYSEAKYLPINLRRFFLNEVSKEIKRKNGKNPEEDTDRQMSKAEKDMLRSKLAMAGSPQTQSTTQRNHTETGRVPSKDGTNTSKKMIRFD